MVSATVIVVAADFLITPKVEVKLGRLEVGTESGALLVAKILGYHFI